MRSHGLALSGLENASDDSAASSIRGSWRSTQIDMGGRGGLRARPGVLTRRILRRSKTTGDVGRNLRGGHLERPANDSRWVALAERMPSSPVLHLHRIARAPVLSMPLVGFGHVLQEPPLHARGAFKGVLRPCNTL